MRLGIAATVLSTLILTPLLFSAQQPPQPVAPPPPVPAAPVLRAGTGPEAKPLPLAKAEIRSTVRGLLAETTLLLTFRNDEGRVLEGELTLPLPEGATVSGFGLDVNGTVVDGVPVEKQQARVSYETEVRKGIDPGLIEHVTGNNFRTRVYPIPAHGTRTVKLQYVSDLSGAKDRVSHVIPLDWKQKLPECSVRLEVVGFDAQPAVRGGIDGLTFQKKDGAWLAEASAKDVAPGDVSIHLPNPPARLVSVERRTKQIWTVEEQEARAKAGVAAAKPEYYFVIHDAPAIPGRPPVVRAAATRIGVLWDASLSRAPADKSRELELLTNLLAGIGNGQVDLVVFRDTADAPVTFDITGGKADKLIEHLKGLTYDGATNLGAVRADRGEAGRAFFLLFTDGNSNFGTTAMPQPSDVPVYAISNAAEANHALLRHFAQSSGGAYVNLRTADADTALRDIGQAPFSLVSLDFDKDKVSDVYPAPATPVQGRIAISGRLLAPEATVTLNYGFGKERVTHSERVTLRQADATETGLVPRFWAQQKVADLSVFPERNSAELLRIGREFGIVTPNTSLIVLETADQYVQHRIVPPQSRPEVYREFLAKIEQRKADEVRSREQKVQRALAMWDERVKWWEAKHEYPANFVYVEPPKPAKGAVVAGQEVRLNEFADRAGAAPAIQPAGSSGGLAPAPLPPEGASRPRGAVQQQQQAASAAGDRSEEGRSATGVQGAGGLAARRPQPAQQPAAGAAAGDATGRAPAETLALRDAQDHEEGEVAARGRGGEADQAVAGRRVESVRELGRVERRGALFRSRSDTAAHPADGTASADRRGLATDLYAQLGTGTDPNAAIAVKAWSPDTPYLKAMQSAGPKDAYPAYLDQRKTFGAAPAFYLDCGDWLLRNGDRAAGIRVLSNIAELHLDDARLLRIVAHRLSQIGERDLAISLFEKILQLRPEEPQSSRDLALALANRADERAKAVNVDDSSMIAADYRRALELLNNVVMEDWQRFEGVQVVALMEANRILANAGRLPWLGPVANPLDSRLTKLLDLDVRIVLTWDTDLTDVDLWVTEPSGERCYYEHSRTTIGGLLSRDFTQGYGPEEYCLRRLMPGQYKIQAQFFGSRAVQLLGPTTVQATVITNFGRADEKRQALTLRLSDAKEVVDIGSVSLSSGGRGPG